MHDQDRALDALAGSQDDRPRSRPAATALYGERAAGRFAPHLIHSFFPRLGERATCGQLR